MDKRRILVSVGKNTPSSRQEFEAYPPEKFPIRLHLLFSSRDICLKDSFKTALRGLPRSEARHRFTLNRYTSGVSLRCYFNGMAGLRSFAQILEGKNLWDGGILHDAEVSTQSLVAQAQHLLQHENNGRGHTIKIASPG